MSQIAVRDETQQQAILRGETRDAALGEFDPQRVALIESDAQQQVSSLLSTPVAAATPGQVNIAARRSGYLRAQTKHTQTALLVLSEPWFPGWRATVDGKPAEVLRVDYLLRGIVLPAGEHTVELRFRPLSLLIGAAISASTWFMLAAVWLTHKFRAKRTAASE